MKRWVAHVLRGLTVLAAIGVVVLGYRILNPPDAVDRPPDTDGALTVAGVLGKGGTGPFDVQGYVFLGGGWTDLRLCDSRLREDPPGCVGPFLYLAGVEASDFELDSGEGPDGKVQWSEGLVVVSGTLLGTELTVGSISDNG